MIADDPNHICEQARVYYYDYLYKESRESIPTDVLTHIDRCQHCQTEIDQLETILTESESKGKTNTAAITNLKLHFAYIGTAVNCKTVRPFLPGMVDPALKVGIPTPITVHMDKCQQCAQDLETIQRLELTRKQLFRLAQLFTEKPTPDAKSCEKAQNAVDSVGRMIFEGTSADILRHLCVCPDCRKLLCQYREDRSEELFGELEESPIPCEAVAPGDIFDYVVPYGIDPENDQYAKFRPSLTSHLINCSKCLDKMQVLHDMIYSILTRQESGIVTCFKPREQSEAATGPKLDDLYADWPIEVEVLDKSKLTDASCTRPSSLILPQGLKQRILPVKFKRFIKPAVAAAAVIIVAVLLMFDTPVAKGVSLEQLYKTIKQVKNVCLTYFVPEKREPLQTKWISKSLNIQILRTDSEIVLWDVRARTKKVRNLDVDSLKREKLNEDVFTDSRIREIMDMPGSVLPFENISHLPKDTKWQKVSDKELETTIPFTEVYDLTWTEKSFGNLTVYKRWRGYIDTDMKLPVRIEWWKKPSKDEDYKLSNIIGVSYPTTEEMLDVFKQAGF